MERIRLQGDNLTFIKRVLLLLFTSAFNVITAQVNSVDSVIKCNYHTFYYSNGTKKEEGCFQKKNKEGLWRTYNENGILTFEWTYHRNVKDGPYRAFYKNGSIKAIGKYVKGSISDTLKTYDENSIQVMEIIWKVLPNGTSVKMVERKLVDGVKNTGTIEVIDGKKYMWVDGTKNLIETEIK